MNAFNFNIKLHSVDVATLKAIANGEEYTHCDDLYGRTERTNNRTGKLEYLLETYGYCTRPDGYEYGRIVLGEFEDLKVFKGSDGYRDGDWDKYEKMSEVFRFGLDPQDLIEVGFDMTSFGKEAARDYIEQLEAFVAAKVAAAKYRKNAAAEKAARIMHVLNNTTLDKAIRRLMAEGFTYEDIMQFA